MSHRRHRPTSVLATGRHQPIRSLLAPSDASLPDVHRAQLEPARDPPTPRPARTSGPRQDPRRRPRKTIVTTTSIAVRLPAEAMDSAKKPTARCRPHQRWPHQAFRGMPASIRKEGPQATRAGGTTSPSSTTSPATTVSPRPRKHDHPPETPHRGTGTPSLLGLASL